VFRTGGRESQLEHRLPAELIAHWRTDRDRNRALYAEDRSAIYGGVHVYEKIR
jgi:S-adenosylmethionine-diacylglycerol 3-amino-3-carboxypropyl transferase